MNNLLYVFIKPGEVFASMKEDLDKVPPLLALLLCVAVFSAAQPLFMTDEAMIEAAKEQVDVQANLLERMFGQFGGSDVNEVLQESLDAQSQQMNELLEVMTTPEQLQSQRIIAAFVAPIGAVVWVGFGILILTTYFSIAGSSRSTGRQWSDWLGFTLWSMLPVALYFFLFMIATMLTGDPLPKNYLAPLAWIPGLGENAFAVHLTFGVIWIVWIQTVGMHRWIDRPIPLCLVIVLIPWVLQWVIAAGVTEAFKMAV